MNAHLGVALSGVIPALVAMWIVDRLEPQLTYQGSSFHAFRR
jgi:hypothetical protein